MYVCSTISSCTGTKVAYSRKEILDCNSALFPMPEFTESVFLMGIVKPPFHMVGASYPDSKGEGRKKMKFFPSTPPFEIG